MARQSSSKPSGVRFAALEPQVRRVSATAVRKKWRKLPQAAQDNIRGILTASQQKTGPKVITKKASKTVDEEEAVTKEIVDRLIDRLPRMPFPPSTHDDCFDFELNLHRTRNIESLLASNATSIHLLDAQIKDEERLLEQEKKDVKLLEESLRSNNAHRAQQLKSLHPLVQTMERAERQADPLEVVPFQPLSVTVSNGLDIKLLQEDPAVRPLLGDLRNHLDSMQNNTAALQPVLHALNTAKNALFNIEHQCMAQ